VVTIRYKPALLDNIPAFITVMAHELCHYYLRTGPGEPPDGAQAEEYATDLAVTFLGFGLFQVNNIYHQVNSYEGTSRSHQGYLGELPISYALAIFTSLREINPDQVAAQLGPSPASYYRASLRDLKNRQRWATRLQFLKQH
jgi:hypothetical protein